jgi:hypothetical protein
MKIDRIVSYSSNDLLVLIGFEATLDSLPWAVEELATFGFVHLAVYQEWGLKLPVSLRSGLLFTDLA